MSIVLTPRTPRERIALLVDLLHADGPATVLVPTFSQRDSVRAALAREDAGVAFGVTVDTYEGWLADRWELLGTDGSQLVDSATRLLLMRAGAPDASEGLLQALAQCTFHAPDASVRALGFAEAAGAEGAGAGGVASAGAGGSSAGDAAGADGKVEPPVDAAERGGQADAGAPEADARLTAAEREFLGRIATYIRGLAERGLREPAQAHRLLAEAGAFEGVRLIVLDPDFCSIPAEAMRDLRGRGDGTVLIGSCTGADTLAGRAGSIEGILARLFRRTGEQEPTRCDEAVRFRLSAGPRARDKVLVDAVEELAGEAGSIAVVSPNPRADLDLLSMRFPQAQVRARCRVRLGATALGRAIADVIEARELDHPAGIANDLLANPLLRIGRAGAFYSDRLHRGDRLMDAEEMLTDVAMRSHPDAQGFVGLAEEGDWLGAIECLRGSIPRAFLRDGATAALELRAAEGLASLVKRAGELGIGDLDLRALIEAGSVSALVETQEAVEGGEAPRAEGDCADACDAAASQGSDGAARSLEDCAAACDAMASVEGRSEEHPIARVRIDILSMSDCLNLRQAEFDAVILTDLDELSYPTTAPVRPADPLLSKLGTPIEDPSLARTRALLARALDAARLTLVLHRSLNDATASEALPALAFEEIVSCIRPDLASSKGLDKRSGLPTDWLGQVSIAGEDRLLENLPAHPVRLDERGQATPRIGSISPALAELVVPPRSGEGQPRLSSAPLGEEVPEGLPLSASQIESYLECPYQWFTKRRLRLEGIDEGFGSLEQGTFIHSVLEKGFSALVEAGIGKVTDGNMEQARDILGRTFDEVASEQAEHSPGRRFAPVTELERKQVADRRRQLIAYLECEQRLLPTFEPRYFEWRFGQEEPFPYAGCALVGTIDRIDCNDAGQAVIIDYKTSLNEGYRFSTALDQDAAEKEAPEEDSEERAAESRANGAQAHAALPRKIQALLYAQVVRKELGLEPVAALYVNPLTGEIQGAFDPRRIGSEQIPFLKGADEEGARVDPAAFPTFEAALDFAEREIERRIAPLAKGCIEAAPAHAHACEYCPALLCPARRTERKR